MKSSCPLPSDWEEYAMKPEKVAGPFTTQNILFFIAAGCALATSFTSHFNITKHLRRYTEPQQQRQIIRIIYTPVVFAVFSALSILKYEVAEYLQPLIDLYETFALAALWLLFIEYITPNENTRLAYYATLENRVPKGSIFKRKGYEVVPGGSQYWYQQKYLAVFLYVILDTLMTFVQEITQVFDDYCASSFNPRYAHIWVWLIQNISLGWAIDSIIRFYFRMKNEPELAGHNMGMKMVSFKLIVSVNFLQELIFDVLIGTHAIKGSRKVTGYDLKYGIPAALVAFEQIFFALFFHFSFKSREYIEPMKEDMAKPRMGYFRAALHAFTPIDYLRGMLEVPKLLAQGVLPMQTKRNKRSRAGAANYGDDSSTHLEPMSYQRPKMEEGPYSSGPTDITVTGPQETGYSNNFAYNELSYPQQASYSDPLRGRQSPPEYEGYSAESERLQPSGYARAHSRDSSIDGGDARSMRQIV